MKISFPHRTLIILAFICLAACSSLPVDEHAAERANLIVENVRKATSVGFLDVTIDYAEPNLYITGHAYSNAHVARLMRSVVIDRSSNLKLVEITPQNVEGQSTFAFQLVESDIGSIRKWAGPITLKFPRSANSAEISSNMLSAYSLNDFVFLAVVGTGPQRWAVIRSPDGALYRVQEGSYIGIERAMVNEINEKSVILLEQTGTKREINVFTENNTNTDGAALNYNHVTISEIGISMNLPQSWPKGFGIVAGSPSTMTTASPFVINMRRNGGGTDSGTFSVMSITMCNFTKSDRFGTLFQDNKLIGAEIYSKYIQMPNHENIEFRELDDGSNALMYGRYMLNLNHAPADKILPNIHIPNSIGFVGARKIGNAPYTTYEIYAVNKGRMVTIVIAVPTSVFSELKPEMDKISQTFTYAQ